MLAREWRRRGVQDVLREELRWREDSEERRRGCCGIRKEYVDDESLAVHAVARQKRLFKLDRDGNCGMCVALRGRATTGAVGLHHGKGDRWRSIDISKSEEPLENYSTYTTAAVKRRALAGVRVEYRLA